MLYVIATDDGLLLQEHLAVAAVIQATAGAEVFSLKGHFNLVLLMIFGIQVTVEVLHNGLLQYIAIFTLQGDEIHSLERRTIVDLDVSAQVVCKGIL